MSKLPNKVNPGQKIKAVVFNQLLDYIRDITPRGDNATIKVRRLPGGSIISLIGSVFGGNSNAGDAYKGYFKVIQTAPNKIKIVDGSDIEAANCFSGYMNKLKVNIPVAELTISEDCIVYLESVTVGDPATSYTNTFKTAAALPDWVADTECSIVSTVKFTAPVAPATVGAISDFNRHDVPNHIIVWGAC